MAIQHGSEGIPFECLNRSMLIKESEVLISPKTMAMRSNSVYIGCARWIDSPAQFARPVMRFVAFWQSIQVLCRTKIHGATMRSLVFAVLALSAWIAIPAQQFGSGATTINATPNLPIAKIG